MDGKETEEVIQKKWMKNGRKTLVKNGMQGDPSTFLLFYVPYLIILQKLEPGN